MRKLILSAVLAAAAVTAPASASAATDFGNACTATTTSPGVTVVMTGKAPANPLPIAAPVAGVITKAKFTLPVTPITIPTEVKTLRPTGPPGTYQVIESSSSLPVTGGTSSYDVRLPVQVGDLLGVASGLGSLMCSTPNAGDTVGTAPGLLPPGASAAFASLPSTAIPLVASIEPDADADGYGDETQDGCPQSAAYHDACPVVIVDSFAAPDEKSLTVLVTTDNEGSVTVTGTAKVKKAKGGKGKRKSTKVKLKGGTQTVAPGDLAKFKVKYPKALMKALAKLPANKAVKATLTATATDVIGRETADTSKAKLPGQG